MSAQNIGNQGNAALKLLKHSKAATDLRQKFNEADEIDIAPKSDYEGGTE